MEQLTPRQIYNREYYRKNAKKICQQKRDGYSIQKPPKKSKPPKRNPLTVKKVKPEVINPPKRVSPQELAKAKARKRIEDIELAR
ncbi:hypothetical protein [Vibrio sp. E150_018]